MASRTAVNPVLEWTNTFPTSLTERSNVTPASKCGFRERVAFAGEYRIAKLYVEGHDWLAHKSLLESRLREGGLIARARQPERFFTTGTQLHQNSVGNTKIPWENDMDIQVGGFFGFILLVLDIWAIVRIVQSHAGTGSKVLWVVIIILLPLLGFILWLLFGPRD